MGEEFRSSLAGWLCLRVSHEIVVDNFLRLQSFEILTGLEFTSKMVPSYGFHIVRKSHFMQPLAGGFSYLPCGSLHGVN